MTRNKSFMQWVNRWWAAPVAAFLLLLNVTGNLTTFYAYHKPISVVVTLLMSAVVATGEWVIYHWLRKLRLHNVFLVVITAMHLLVVVVDTFLINQFGFIFNDHSMYILAATDRDEIRAFLTAYLSVAVVIGIVVALVLIIVSMWLAARYLSRTRWFGTTNFGMTMLGLVTVAVIGVSYVVWHTGLGVGLPETHAFSRVGLACKAIRDRLNEFEVLRQVNRDVKATLTTDTLPTVVVIVGESFSVYHSSLYGYAKPTNPLLAQRVADSTLTVYDDVVSPADFTDGAMCAMFSLTRPGEQWWAVPLFPVVFHQAGYHTQSADAQYVIGGGLNSFFFDADLSHLMFDQRNPVRFSTDGEILTALRATGGKQFVLVHLWGQHYTYSERYTPEFARFKPTDYAGTLTDKQRQVVAHYDNATCYNDYIIDQIIRIFEQQDCIVVYLGDHGEEVYEVDDYMGHGNALHRPDPTYQHRVPLMVWLSDKFSEARPQLTQRIRGAAHTPITTDDLPHFLLDVVGINNDHFCPELSFINPNYNPNKPRHCQNGLEYNKVKSQPRVSPRY